jgi:type II secretory pathway pseudopilin PulG
VTLVELLVVISIIGALMAIGAGVWIKFRAASTGQEAYARLAALARRARVFALEESTDSRLVLDVKKRAFYAEGLRLVGMWHLEGATDSRRPWLEAGFAGRELTVAGGFYQDPDRSNAPVRGYRGGAVRFNGPGCLIMADEAFVFPAGGELSCYLYPENDSAATGQRQLLWSRGKELEVLINAAGELSARSGSVSLTTEGYRLPALRWSQVAFFFSPAELRLAVDGVVRGRTSPGDLPGKKEEQLPLVFGDDRTAGFPFVGTVDEPALRRVAREAEYQLPGQIEVVSPVGAVRFDAAGMLDRRYHAGPVRIGIKRLDNSAPGGSVTRWIGIALDGEIREE